MSSPIADAYVEKKKGKAPLQKLDPEFLIGMARVCGFGDAKHADTHWTEGLPWSEILGAVKRHIAQFEMGFQTDDESGEQHLCHAAVGLMFLHHYANHMNKYGNMDDMRFRPGSCTYNSGG